VLAASTVTNTGASTLDGSLGLWPGTSITGFPPGLVLPPSTTDSTNAAALHAKADLTVAYVNAAGRSVDATTTADLANLHVSPGVYAGPAKSPLGLTGPLVLDGGGNLSSVFIFQTDSTLTTASASTVTLINGAQECNVFWKVGSSATLGTGSVFRGNILALASVTVTNGVVVHGRALARNGAVTLDNDTFVRPTCAQPGTLPGTTGTTASGTGGTTTATTSGRGVTLTTAGNGGTPSTGVGAGTPTNGGSGGTPTNGGSGGTPTTGVGGGTPSASPPQIPGVPGVVGPPRTGGAPLSTGDFPWVAWLATGLTGVIGAVVLCRWLTDDSAPAVRRGSSPQ
jgi:hypothetical protein